MNTATWAERYVTRFDFALTPLRGKAPYFEAWNTAARLIRTPAAAREHWRSNPSDNLGVCLEPSGLVSLDCDTPDVACKVLDAEGIHLDELIACTPTIVGRAPRLEFMAPLGVSLGRKAVTWPARAPGDKPITVIEFRAGRVQDVLPPSIHPDTGRPYAWHTPPTAGFPELPTQLLAIWQDFEAFKRRALALCPWAPPPAPTPPPRAPRPRRPREVSVIHEFNQAHDVAAILKSHGYRSVGKKRWKSPNGHGIAGVVLLPSGKVFCHHASDTALSGEHALDAFDLFRIFDHNGDYQKATRAAAQLLGLDRKGPRDLNDELLRRARS